jgi:superfamily II DNA or RNA helicase/HKD family nuclease
LSLSPGLYEALLSEQLRDVVERHPELRSIFGKLDDEEKPARYAAFISRVLEKALRAETDVAARLRLCNEIVTLIAGKGSTAHLADQRLIDCEKAVLRQVTPTYFGEGEMPRPKTSLVESSLFTGSPNDPQLANELCNEMASADSVDVLVSFIKWSGLRLLMSSFEELTRRGGTLRLVTTSYMGASDAPAVEAIAALPNTKVCVSYDTERTRLHAKAYHFVRKSGFSTAFIGSANMSNAAMTSGLEWNLKVTAQDLPHIIEKFVAEFETYWNSREFVPFNPAEPETLRSAIGFARSRTADVPVFFDIRPHAFQERILDALEAERRVHGQYRNLVVAATGTGKTVVAAFDFKRFYEENGRSPRLLFIAHRQQILQQALGTFRAVLRLPDFGELLVGPFAASRLEHLFCSVDMFSSRRLWEQVGNEFYDFVIVDEVHHGPASSYRPIFDHLRPKVLLGLTATPERMDGENVAADFGNRFAAEIRLPEALEEKLLCPFHYFGVSDPVSTADDSFWRNGQYDSRALERAYTGAHATARQRLDAIVGALQRYEPDLSRVRGIGFCVTIAHAQFMAQQFNQGGISSAVVLGDTPADERTKRISDFKAGRLSFLFTVDVLSEGLDIPEITTVLFLRPTDSLTVFLQQLGRGLRHYPGKDCVTVIDLVGQVHRRYRIDRKFKALLSKTRFNIEREVEAHFPHLPSGCAIQLDRVAREHVLENIRENFRRLAEQVPERLETFTRDTGLPLTFANFVDKHDYEPAALLDSFTWTDWLAKAGLAKPSSDPNKDALQKGLVRLAQTTGPKELSRIRAVAAALRKGDVAAGIAAAEKEGVPVHYRFWGEAAAKFGASSIQESFRMLASNPTFLDDVLQVVDWAAAETQAGAHSVELPFRCALEMHGQYSNNDIKAALGLANLERSGSRGVGLLHNAALRVYALLITFQKVEQEFSPTTMYADYPISRELLHWESQSNTTQESITGQTLVAHKEKGYTVLLFARDKRREPFTYLGPGQLVTFQGERPIQITWRLVQPMPAKMLEDNRRGG